MKNTPKKSKAKPAETVRAPKASKAKPGQTKRAEKTPSAAAHPETPAPKESSLTAQRRPDGASSNPVPGGIQEEHSRKPSAKAEAPKIAETDASGPPGQKARADHVRAKTPKRRVGNKSALGAKDLKVPAILLEGDAPAGPSLSGPGLRYALAPQPSSRAGGARVPELPEAYGTGRIFLAARDPHWVYAAWDFTAEQQRELNVRSRDGHLVLRVFAADQEGAAVPEVHVHPESRNWFINVPFAETRYTVEIGFYNANGSWTSVSASQPAFTPPEAPSHDLSAEFASLPPQVSFKQVAAAVEQFVTRQEGQPLLEAVAQAQQQQAEIQSRSRAERAESASGDSGERGRSPARSQRGSDRHAEESRVESHGLPKSARPGRRTKAPPSLPVRIEPGAPWNREQRLALKRLVHIDERRRVFLGSIEITELVRRQLEEEELASIAAQEKRGGAAQFRFEEALPAVAPGMSSLFAVGIPKTRGRNFWFKVNAELIIYGATEPDARVTVAGRNIKLRPDGTFSFRFSLPDGRYQLPAVAFSGDGEEAREARLEFGRSTEYRGRVEAHSQDAGLRPPRVENIQ